MLAGQAASAAGLCGPAGQDHERERYYSIDTFTPPWRDGRGVRFRYFEYNVRKEKVFRREGAWYAVFPHGLIWDDENYYLVGYDEEKGGVRHYRVDKMAELDHGPDRQGGWRPRGAGRGGLCRQAFRHVQRPGRAGAPAVRERPGGVVLDRFGQESILVPDGRNHFTVTVDAVVSPSSSAGSSAWGIGWSSWLRTGRQRPSGLQLDAVGANYGGKTKD